MPALVFDVSAMDRASQAFARIADRIDMLVARLTALNGATASPRVDVDTDPADRTLGRWTMTFRRRVRDVMSNIPMDLDPTSTSQIEATMARLRAELAALLDKKINIDISGEEALAEVQRIKAEMAALDLIGADIEVRADVGGAIADLEKLMAELRRVDGEEAEVKVKADTRSFKDVLNGIALFQRTIAQLSKPFVIMAAMPGVVSLIADLQSLLGLLGLLPALAFGGVAAIGTLMTAFNGMGDAITESDPEKLAVAFAALSPNAREAAFAIRNLMNEWSALGKVVQDNMFEGVSTSIRTLTTNMLPTLQAGMQGVADGFSDMFNQWAEWAAQADTVQQTAGIFEDLRTTIQNIGPAFTFIAEALTDMVTVGMDMLPQLAAGFTGAAENFRNFIQEVTANGQFEAWIRGAMTTLGEFITLGGNIIGIFQGLFDAIAGSGQTTLQMLIELTQQMETFVTSADGQAGIAAFFTTIRDVVAELAPGIEAVVTAILGTFIAIGPELATVAGAVSDLAGAFASVIPTLGIIAAGFAPLIGAFGALVGAMGPVPGIVLGVWIALRGGIGLMAAVGNLFTFLAARAAAAAISIGFFATSTSLAGMAGLATAVGAVARAFAGLSVFLAGPWGVAILAAVAVIGILATSTDTAADAAANHQAKVESLIGTLDQYTGAITAATKEQIAHDLAMTMLADGSTRLVTAVQQAGINFEQFTQAASGNEKALATVNAQLVAVTGSTLETAEGMGTVRNRVEEGRFTWEDYTLAVLGNVEAQERMVESSGLTEFQIQNLVNTGRDAVGNLDELGMILGDTAGSLDDAQAAARDAAEAMADFGAALQNTQGALEEYGDIIDDVTGAFDPAADGAGQLAESFADLTFNAQATANNLGDTEAAMNGMASAVEVVGQSMQTSRDAFIGMAIDAGIGAEAAEALANQLGLIPEVAQIIFETNADETEAALIRIVGAILAMPDAKTLTIDAPTDEVLAALDALGIAVTELPDGQVQLNLDDAEFQAKLQAAIDQGMTLPEFLAFLDLDIAQAQAALDAFMNPMREGGLNVPISLELETEGATEELGTWKTQAEEGGQVMAILDMDPLPADTQLLAFVERANASILMPLLNLDVTPAQTLFDAFLALVNGSIGVMTIDAVDGPAQAVLGALLDAVNSALGTITIDADPAPAMGKLADTKAAVDGTTGIMTIDADAGPALSAAGAAVAAINGMTATITVTTRQVTVFETRGPSRASTGGGGFASGGAITRFARGGIVPGYAPGIDRIPAMLSPGEAVLVPEAVRLLGTRAIVGLNKIASGGRKASAFGKNGADTHFSMGTPGGSGMGVPGMASAESRTYILNVYNAGNNEINLREQFRRMEVLGV